MQEKTKAMTDLEISYEEHITKKERALAPLGMDALLQTKQHLDERGFRGDADVVLLGLEEMEDELTMEQAERQHRLAPFVNTDRRRAVASPFSMADPDIAREARANDIDNMERPEWRDEE